MHRKRATVHERAQRQCRSAEQIGHGDEVASYLRDALVTVHRHLAQRLVGLLRITSYNVCYTKLLRLLEERRHQPVGLTPVLHALAHRVDARIEGLQRVIHHHAALAVQPSYNFV